MFSKYMASKCYVDYTMDSVWRNLPEHLVDHVCNKLPYVRRIPDSLKGEILKMNMLRDMKKMIKVKTICDDLHFSWMFMMTYDECVKSYNAYKETGNIIHECCPWDTPSLSIFDEYGEMYRLYDIHEVDREVADLLQDQRVLVIRF